MKFEKSRLDPIKLELGGVEYPVRITFKSMAYLEEALGMPFMELVEKKFSGYGSMSAIEIQHALYALLIGGDVEVDIKDLAEVDFTLDVIDILMLALTKANKILDTVEIAGADNSEKKIQTT